MRRGFQSNGGPTREKMRFPHYPVYPIPDAVFAQILLIHASLGIHLSVVMTGESAHLPKQFAVQVCRITLIWERVHPF